jgi:hypothetical protein
VFVGTSPDDLEFVGTVSPNATSFSISDGEDKSTYYVAVATLDVAGNVAELSPVTDGITVDMTAPSPVTPRDGGEWTSGNVLAFEWDGPEDADLVDRTYVTIVTGTGSTVDTWELEGVVTAHEMVGTVDGVTYHCRVAFRDEAGNVGHYGEASDGITVDLTAPTQVDVSPPPAIVLKGPIQFEWTTAEDAGSGVMMYEVYVGLDIDPHDATTTEGRTYTLMEPHGNSTYHCRVRAVDVAGNAGPWSPLHAGVYIYDGTPDVALEIGGGALMTSSAMVGLRLSYDDMMSAVDMRVSETEGMTGVDWETYATSSTFYIQGRDGAHTVHVQVRNELGVVGEASASIILDTTAPAIVFETKDGKTTGSDTITVRGSTEPSAILTHAGVQVPVAADGSFEVEVPLVLGNNIIELTAEDELGNSATASVVVKREPGSEWTPTTRGVSILLLVVVMVLVGVIAYIFMRGRRDEADEWTEMPEDPAP